LTTPLLSGNTGQNIKLFKDRLFRTIAVTETYDISFHPFKLKGRVQKGITLFEAAEHLGVLIRSDCGGKGICGKCRVKVDPPHNLDPKTGAEEESLPLSEWGPSYRLACRAKILGPVTVTIPEELMLKEESSGKTGVKGFFPVFPGERDTNRTRLGAAFDVGTTTVAAYLCDLNSGKILVSKAMVNPQRPFGEDVISRIAAILSDKANLEKQQQLVAGAMNELIASCLEETRNHNEDIEEITVVGNTTMQHIFAGFNPKSLGVSPYVPVTCSSVTTSARDLGLDLPPRTPVYIFPVISGFLGGDILAAFLADQPLKREETTLIIDIGTNGELILSSGKGIWATSCATGPALEGAQISCGMRAASGAVSRVFFRPESASPIVFETIDNAKPMGICGSGIIDALAAMRKADVTLENGTFNPEAPGVVLNGQGTGQKFILPDTDVHITLKDVRQVQLAKAALFVGIESLLKKAGVARVDHTILTGAFGAKFDWQNARDIGMLPKEILEGKVDSAQNLAGTGAVMALLDKRRRTEIESIALEVEFLDLACEPDFTLKFSSATRFPTLDKDIKSK
jgi:uncharacterized 2Fe-2S/4Fe-4S cluster protein (DUF4445 family)